MWGFPDSIYFLSETKRKKNKAKNAKEKCNSKKKPNSFSFLLFLLAFFLYFSLSFFFSIYLTLNGLRNSFVCLSISMYRKKKKKKKRSDEKKKSVNIKFTRKLYTTVLLYLPTSSIIFNNNFIQLSLFI